MKIRSIILFALLPAFGFSQKKANLEISSGLNYTDYSHKINDSDGRLNYDFGLGMTLPMKNPKRSFLLGIRFVSYGDKYGGSNLRWGIQNDGEGGYNPNIPSGEEVSSISSRSSYNFIELPVGVRQYLTHHKTRFFLQATAGPSYFVNGRSENTLGYNDGSSSTFVNNDKSSNLRNLNFVANLGLGIEIPISEKLGIQCQTHAQTQLLDIATNSETHAKWYAAGLRAGLRYRLF